jgi:DNA-binding MarR family transcriptional regulator
MPETSLEDELARAVEELPPAVCERLGFLFGKLHQAILRMGRESGALSEPLTGRHFGCLSLILDEGPMSQHELGQRMGVDRTSCVAVVDDLEAAGYVDRRRNPVDRRAYALQATREGKAWQTRAEHAVLEAERELLATLSPAEQRTLIELLQRLVASQL